MSEDNPVASDLEVAQNNNPTSNSNSNPVADIAAAIETILSEEHLDQKTNITGVNEQGLIGIDVVQAHMKRSFNYEFPSLVALKLSKQEHALSVGGYRSNQIVEIFKSIQTNIVSGTENLGRRLMGR